jgi:hypothetical protein
MLVKHKPRLVWLQWGIEQLSSTIVWPLQLLLRTLAAAARTSPHSSSSSSSSTTLLQQQGQRTDVFKLVAMPPGIAPDVETHAGRLVLAVSMGLMLLVVLYLPLLFAWRLERHLKARFMATILQRASESNSSSPLSSPSGKGICGGGSSSKAAFDPSNPSDPASCTPSSSSAACASSKAAAAAAAAAFAPAKGSSSCATQRSTAAGGTAGGCTAAGGTASGCTAGGIAGSPWVDDWIKPPAAFPLFPTEKGALRRHLLIAAGSCFALGEIFVWLCTISPLVASSIWPQVAQNPSFTLPEDN